MLVPGRPSLAIVQLNLFMTEFWSWTNNYQGVWPENSCRKPSCANRSAQVMFEAHPQSRKGTFGNCKKCGVSAGNSTRLAFFFFFCSSFWFTHMSLPFLVVPLGCLPETALLHYGGPTSFHNPPTPDCSPPVHSGFTCGLLKVSYASFFSFLFYSFL